MPTEDWIHYICELVFEINLLPITLCRSPKNFCCVVVVIILCLMAYYVSTKMFQCLFPSRSGFGAESPNVCDPMTKTIVFPPNLFEHSLALHTFVHIRFFSLFERRLAWLFRLNDNPPTKKTPVCMFSLIFNLYFILFFWDFIIWSTAEDQGVAPFAVRPKLEAVSEMWVHGYNSKQTMSILVTPP